MRRQNRRDWFEAKSEEATRSGLAPSRMTVAAKVNPRAGIRKTLAAAIIVAAPFVGGCSLDAGNDLIKSSPIDDVIWEWGTTGELSLGTELRRRLVEIAATSGAGGLREALRKANARCRSIDGRIECELDRFRTLRGIGLAYFTTRGRISWHIRVSFSRDDKLIDGLVVVVTASSVIL